MQLSMWERSAQGNQFVFWSALETQSLSVGADLWVSSASKCHGGRRGMATGTRTIRKGLHCCVPNDAFLNCPSLLQPQNRTAWEQLSRAGRKKGLEMRSSMKYAPSLPSLAISSAGSKHLCCAGEAKLGHELESWAGSHLGCTSKDRDSLLCLDLSLFRELLNLATVTSQQRLGS